MELILDPGSTHMGKKDYAIEIVETAAHCGASAVKFQLFRSGSPQDTGGNIPLPYEWMRELKFLGDEVGVEVFASVFDADGLNVLHDIGCKSVKIAYSMTGKCDWPGSKWEKFDTVYQSYDLMNVPKMKFRFEKFLYCIPEYPVKYMVDFTPLAMFDGFSDHTIGTWQTMEACNHTTLIEKHFKIDRPDVNCPDARFAITPKEVKHLTETYK